MSKIDQIKEEIATGYALNGDSIIAVGAKFNETDAPV